MKISIFVATWLWLVGLVVAAGDGGDGGGKPAARPAVHSPTSTPRRRLPTTSTGVPAAAAVPAPNPVPVDSPTPASAPAAAPLVFDPRSWFRTTVPPYLGPGEIVAWDLPGWWNMFVDQFMVGLRAGGIEPEFFQLLEAIADPEVYRKFVEEHLRTLVADRQAESDTRVARALQDVEQQFERDMAGRSDMAPRSRRALLKSTKRHHTASWKSYQRGSEGRFKRNVWKSCGKVMAGMANLRGRKKRKRRGGRSSSEESESDDESETGSLEDEDEDEEEDEEEVVLEEGPPKKKRRTDDRGGAGGAAGGAISAL